MTAYLDVLVEPWKPTPRKGISPRLGHLRYVRTDVSSLTPSTTYYGSLLPYSDTENNKTVEFKHLADRWRKETRLQSNMAIKAVHPAYQQIIGMGKEAVPLILKEFLENRFADWFWALQAIVKEQSPSTEVVAGDIKSMARIWVEWGQKRGLV